MKRRKMMALLLGACMAVSALATGTASYAEEATRGGGG